MSIPWNEIILDEKSPSVIWERMFDSLKDLSTDGISPVTLHDETVVPDRLLSEAAWEVWSHYPEQAPLTSKVLKKWVSRPSAEGKAVLILDALSLRELHLLLGGADAHDVPIANVAVTGAECPTTTDQFARALGVPSRSSLTNDMKPTGFSLFGDSPVYTDVVSLPFEDCPVPPSSNVFVWHSWLDDLIHQQSKLPDQVTKIASTTLQGDGFWAYINKLRQGRKLVITSDHGYAVSKRFSSAVEDPNAIEILREVFSASRCKAANGEWQKRFMPPIVMTHNGHHVVTGQRKWKVQGGFPHICHGGMSLLEAAVPFVEIFSK